jgi:hypothetical protein
MRTKPLPPRFFQLRGALLIVFVALLATAWRSMLACRQGPDVWQRLYFDTATAKIEIASKARVPRGIHVSAMLPLRFHRSYASSLPDNRTKRYCAEA